MTMLKPERSIFLNVNHVVNESLNFSNLVVAGSTNLEARLTDPSYFAPGVTPSVSR